MFLYGVVAFYLGGGGQCRYYEAAAPVATRIEDGVKEDVWKGKGVGRVGGKWRPFSPGAVYGEG